MSNVVNRSIRKNSLPRTGRALDAVPGGVASSGGIITGGSSAPVESEFDILEGEAIIIEKEFISNKLTYTIGHADTSEGGKYS